MTHEELLLFIALIFGFYAAWNIGANDVANAMGTSVGSKALTLRQAVILASIFEFLGAVLFGSNVSKTLETGLLHPEVFDGKPIMLVHGMLASLLATGLWLQFASYCALPVSTTHSIVGAIVGFGAVCIGIDSVKWDNVAIIGVSWIASPLLGAFASYLIFLSLRKWIFYKPHPLAATKKFLPFITAAVAVVLSLTMMRQIAGAEAPILKKFIITIIIAFSAGLSAYLVAKRIKAPHHPASSEQVYDPHISIEVEKAKKNLSRIQGALQGEMGYQLSDIIDNLESFSESLKKSSTPLPHKKTEFDLVEKIFGVLQISSACLMAFAHGSNDVANAIGPMTAIITALQSHLSLHSSFQMWALIMGGAGIVIGLATWGWRVIETIGKKITELTPSRGFSAEFGAALTILCASRLGLPVSTTHTIVGSVLGVGLAGGISALNLNTIKGILLSWVITIPAGAILSIICYYLISNIL